MGPTDATIIGVYFLNYIKSISTCFGSGDKKTRLVNTSCEATCNIGRENLGSIVVHIVSCGIVNVMRLCVRAMRGYCLYCDTSISLSHTSA
jgi:hypothetical protein